MASRIRAGSTHLIAGVAVLELLAVALPRVGDVVKSSLDTVRRSESVSVIRAVAVTSRVCVTFSVRVVISDSVSSVLDGVAVPLHEWETEGLFVGLRLGDCRLRDGDSEGEGLGDGLLDGPVGDLD
jgi:hypothetical protein